mgnify:CR=1 FL=1
MDLHVCIKIDDDAVNKIAKVITETVKRVSEKQKTGPVQQTTAPQRQSEGIIVSAVPQTTAYSAQIAQATQIPVQAMTGQSMSVQQPAQPQSAQAQPVPATQPAAAAQPIPASQAVPQVTAPAQTVAVPTAAKTYTLDELASAAMLLMDRGMQTQLQELLAGYGVEALPMLPPEQYGNFATALRGMGAQI